MPRLHRWGVLDVGLGSKRAPMWIDCLSREQFEGPAHTHTLIWQHKNETPSQELVVRDVFDESCGWSCAIGVRLAVKRRRPLVAR